MNNGVNSIEDLDARLDEEFGVVETNNTEEIGSQETEVDDTSSEIDEPEEVDDTEKTNDDQESETGSNDTTNQTENSSDTKPSKEDKKEFAFAELRKSNKDLTNQLNKANESVDILNRIASNYGYTNSEDFVRDYEAARIAEEAKKKGYDPELYRQLQESNKRIEQLENEAKEQRLIKAAENFKVSLDDAIDKYGVTQEEVFNRLEEAGYDVDTLLSLPKPDVIIKGILSDKIIEISKQTQIEKLETLDGLSENSHNNGSSEKTFSLDELIAQDIKEYKEANYFN